ncbi:transcriptional regulator GcvA [Azospirillum sp. SYSU D00513]|uniref:transcriptional regulator GcvA n=1 Tax=Azospirillum sp. SYSU D00513 TaxID=2812561 RepID=UPI001A97D297|nr:transcriptional regulator GcvA [Azospirillum sp. SYSU D00513]
MARRLPSLHGLRAFEAAARQLSFTRAAEELNVTQSAVSHQIRALEEQMGVALFRRVPQGLLLTEAGQLLLPAVRDAFDRLAVGVERVREHEASGTLTVSVSPYFAGRWLMPRIGRFRALHPGIELRISANPLYVDFTRETDIDLAVRHGLGTWDGLHAVRFLDDQVFPVCSPALRPPLETPEDLRHHALLNDEMHHYWDAWLAGAGLTGLAPSAGLRLTDIGLAIQCAIAGQGVAMARASLIEEELAAGTLIRPFALSIPADFGIYAVCPEAMADRPKIAAFRDWLIAEGRNDQPVLS